MGKTLLAVFTLPLALDARAGDPQVALSSDPLKSQSAGGGYRISFDDDQASVLDEVLNQTYRFQVHSRRSDGVVLLRGKGVGVEVITIDPRNGSFVLTDAGVSQLWNRATAA